MKKILSLLTLLVAIVTGANAAGYTPTDDEVIILNDVYDASKADAGYSTHDAIAWGGEASTNSKKPGDPNNNGVKSKENLPCFSVKGNGKGKNITVSVSGVQKIIIYHEEHSSRYIELLNGGKDGELIGNGAKSTTFTEVELDASTDYSIFLHGTGNGSDDQDFNVYAIKLIPGTPAPVGGATIVTQPQDAEYVNGTADYPNLSVEATATAGAITYEWFIEWNSAWMSLYDMQLQTAGTSTLSGAEAIGYLQAIIPGGVIPVGEYSFKCVVTNEGVGKETKVAKITVKDPFSKHELASISNETTWQLDNSGIEIKLLDDDPQTDVNEATTPAKSDDFYTYADIAELNNKTLPAGFDGTTLAFKGEYVLRNTNGAQNGTLKFNTTVAGTVTVEFSNTGGSNSDRYVLVTDANGSKTGETEAVGTTHNTESFNVAAGDVEITGVAGTEGGNPALRFYSITFTPADADQIPSVTLNSEGFATFSFTKAVKVAEGTTAKAYYAEGIQGNKLTITETSTIPAEQGAIIYGTPGTVVNFVESDEEIQLSNLLRPTTTANGLVPVPSSSFDTFVSNALTLDGSTFKTFKGEAFNANRAYILKSEIVNDTKSLEIAFNGQATAVDAVAEAAETEAAPVKVIKGGKLYIGNYNVAGQQVK